MKRQLRFPAGLCCVSLVLALSGGILPAADYFVRGDVDQGRVVRLSDAVRIFNFLFRGQRIVIDCLEGADVNDDGRIDISDPVYLVRFLVQGGPMPLPPFSYCDRDPTADSLGCDSYPICALTPVVDGVLGMADGIFFVADKSGTVAESGGLSLILKAIHSVLARASANVHFGIIFFSADLWVFPASRKPASAADPDMKASGIAFVQGIFGGGGTCPQKGLLAALDFVDSSTAKENVIIYLSDGGGTCGNGDEVAYLKQTLDVVTARNAGKARIDTIGVSFIGAVGEKYLQDLAAQNGGTYTKFE